MLLKQFTTQDVIMGTYAAIRFDEVTCAALTEFAHTAKIPNPVTAEKYHATIIYSRRECPNLIPLNPVFYVGTPLELEIWTQRTGDRCLVLKFDCEELSRRHYQIRKVHAATHDFDDYTPHITLSYDVGNLSVKDVPDISKYVTNLKATHEYVEPLILEA